MSGHVRSIAVVGASVAGMHTVEQLRANGYDGKITLIGSEAHLPYDRPPLSKQVLVGTTPPEDVFLSTAGELHGLDVDVRLGVAASALASDHVVLEDGTVVPAERMVVATGVSPRQLPGQREAMGVFSLRTIEDAVRLRDRLERSRSLVVIGGGFIGGEVASAARMLDLDVTVLEVLDQPMRRVLGSTGGRLLADLYAVNGVCVRNRSSAVSVVPTASGARIVLGDGSELEADTVVVGVGSTPNTGWLPPGVRDAGGWLGCDDRGQITGLPFGYAVGDVASWPDRRTGERYRTEHWTSARSQAETVARDLTGVAQPEATLPDYFWTDQFGLKLQVIGRPEIADQCTVLSGGGPAVAGSVLGYFAANSLVAVALFGVPRYLARFTKLVAAAAGRSAALEAARESLQAPQTKGVIR
ncbi:MAG TPA: FAD-dependent oxidoreductase [Streptosporangiaceae bacterium]|nr:FAD-dependent oxidoreductase [Streptosporangiaceae bacterium]